MENLDKIKGNLIKELAKEVIEEIEIKKKKEKRNKRLHNTKLLMNNYNALKAQVGKIEKTNIEYECEDEEEVVFIESITRTRLRTITMLGYIERALKIVKQDYRKKSEKFKILAFEKYYFDKKQIEEISKDCNCSISSARRYIDCVIDDLSLLLWGVDSLEF